MKNVFSPDEQIRDPKARIVAAMERLSTIFKSSLQDMAKRYNLTPLQAQLLIFIAGHSKDLCSVSQLAKEFSVTKATASDSLKTLTGKGYLKKEANPLDSRAFHYAIEASARPMIRELEQFGLTLSKLLAPLSNTERQALSASLLQLINLLQQGGFVPSRMCYSCHYYEKTGTGFHCHLLNKDLSMQAIRLDCPEHETAQ